MVEDDSFSVKAAEKRTWSAFSARNAQSPFVSFNPLYPLPCRLIEIIQNKIKNFFDTEEVKFETDLSSTVSSCFFYRRPIGLLVNNQDDMDERIKETSRELDRLSKEADSRLGLDSSYTEQQSRNISKWATAINETKKAYSGWLISNEEYVIDLISMIKKWGARIEKDGLFPILKNISKSKGKFQSSFYRFYCRWGLETLETWLMPVPIDPDLELGFPTFREHPSSAGVNIFLPYYMLRGEVLDYRELFRSFRANPINSHLHVWTRINDKHRTKVGDKRLVTILSLFKVFFLALRFRYYYKLKSNMGKIDEALSVYYKCSVDKVSDARQSLQRIYPRISHESITFFDGEAGRG